MKNRGFSLALASCLLAGGLVHAQAVIVSEPETYALQPLFPSAGAPTDAFVCGPPGQFWARGEYLLWWAKGNDLPPLVTTSPPGTPPALAGVLGAPGTVILFGDDEVNDDSRSGGRLTLGLWLNPSQTTGVEGNFFGLDSSTTQFSAASGGLPILARPFFNVLTGAQDSLLVAYPGIVSGSILINSRSSDLWGAEVYLRQNLCCGCCYRLDGLAGYRFLGFNDNLDIFDTEIDVVTGDRVDVFAHFGARNRFHGGQIGLIGEARCGIWFVEGRAKVALGGNARTVTINGATSFDGAPPVPGGFLAVLSNSGVHNDSKLAVVPEGGVNVGCQVSPCLRAFLGYTFIYLSDAVRSGGAINLAVNPNLIPPPVLVGPLQPAFISQEAGFWVQGISFGLELRF